MAETVQQVQATRIAVIAASNLGYANPGMLTVDLAAAGVLKRAAPNSVLSWYTLHPPDQFCDIHPYLDPSALPFNWLPLLEHFDDVCSHDLIVLWGDFLQARHYYVQDAADRVVQGSHTSMSAEQALEVLYRCLLFSDATLKVLSKIIVFGSTILFNRQTDYSRDRYGEHVFRLFRNCGGAWARDPLSAVRMQHMRQDYSTAALGTDAAFLLRDEDLVCLPTTSWIHDPPFADRIGLFLGVRTRPPGGLVRFLRNLARQLRLQLEWLPWFPVHEWLRAVPRRMWLNPVIAAYVLKSRRRIDSLLGRGTTYSAGDIFAAIGKYRFIVTDTYHLCVNAWRVGTPAICFGSPEGAPKHQTLDDFKKRVLYEMYDATDFYFSTSSVRSSSGRKLVLDKVRQLIDDRSIAAAITGRIRAHACQVERSFAERLSGLVPR
jgi:hypothetical protein